MTQFQKLYSMIIVQLAGGFELPSLKREEGQTLAEYAMILALLAIAIVAAVIFLGGKIGKLFSQIATSI